MAIPGIKPLIGIFEKVSAVFCGFSFIVSSSNVDVVWGLKNLTISLMLVVPSPRLTKISSTLLNWPSFIFWVKI